VGDRGHGTRIEAGTRLADRARRHSPPAGLLGLAAVLYLWGLTRNGYANEFYAAAVKAGTQSWKALLFGSLDASNYITVDKPPASLWAMELSGRIFGFSSFSLLLPQALAGVASVGLLYATVRRWFGSTAALLSGLVLALTPVAALMFRFDNPDALLVLLLVAGAYAVTRAIERAPGRAGTWWLALAGTALGFAFLTKMLQAFLVLPAFALVYLVAAPTSLRRRIGQVIVGCLALVVASGWWVALVELWPAGSRPYIGGSTNNSIIDLIWGYNGLGRLESSGGPGGGFSGGAGFLRLFDLQMGGQIAWLLPAALIVLAAGLVATLRAPRTDRTRAALLLWGGWLVVTAGVFSFMTGVIHPYYTNTLAPPIAVLVGAGSVLLWRKRGSVAASLVLATTVAATAAWSYRLLDRTPEWHPWLRYAVLCSGLGAAAALAIAPTRVPRGALVTAALVAALAGPAAYTLSTVTTAYAGSTPAAGPTTALGSGFPGGPGAAGVSSELASLLEQNASRYTWVAATSSSMSAAPIELATGKAVMAIGGFTGSDPSITLARFEQLVAAGKIHYYVAGGQGGPGGGRGGSSSEIESWVTSTFGARTVGGTTVYDLTAKA
jgi:4-amino-4-deoxy-L-arabinose transferase-like glycosyltransferase